MALTKKILAIVFFTILAIWLGHEFKLHLIELEAWVTSLGAYAPLGFVLFFVAVSPLFISIDVLCFTAGVLFPLLTGELAIITATYFSAAFIFILGRDLFRERVENFISSHPRFAVLDKVINDDNALKLLFLLRLTPLPFAILSYALAVTRVKFWPYLVATSGILFYNCTLVYLGYATKHLTGLATGLTPERSISYPMIFLSLSALIAVLVYIAKLSAKALKEFNIDNV